MEVSMLKVKTLDCQPPLFRDIAFTLFASFLLGLFAYVSIPLPFTPIPIATQPHIVLLLAALLGVRRAGAAVFSFLSQGALGLPVFAGGAAGAAILFGPRGGYLIGYLVAAFVVGWILEKREKTLGNTAWALIAGNFTIYLFGAGYLATMIGMQKAFFLGVAPFLLGDALKILACMKILQRFGSFKTDFQ